MTGTLVFTDDVSEKAQGGQQGSGLDLFSYGDAKAAAVPAPGLTGLLIRFSLSLIPQLNPPGAALDYVFQVAGTDDETRDLMELLFDSGALGDVEVELLLPAGAANSGAGYKTGTADNQNTRILKTNLSTYNQPNLALPRVLLRGRGGGTGRDAPAAARAHDGPHHGHGQLPAAALGVQRRPRRGLLPLRARPQGV